jgi:hypothetical protein
MRLLIVFVLWTAPTAAMAFTAADEETVYPVIPADLPPAMPGPTVLTMETPGGVRDFTLADLEALGPHALNARMIWQEENDLYHGVLLSDLLTAAGMQDLPAVRVFARDGYTTVIPRGDWTRWPLLLATRRAGMPMTVRGKGPLRLIYPLTPEMVLTQPEMDSRWVWMLTRIEPEGVGP